MNVTTENYTQSRDKRQLRKLGNQIARENADFSSLKSYLKDAETADELHSAIRMMLSAVNCRRSCLAEEAARQADARRQGYDKALPMVGAGWNASRGMSNQAVSALNRGLLPMNWVIDGNKAALVAAATAFNAEFGAYVDSLTMAEIFEQMVTEEAHHIEHWEFYPCGFAAILTTRSTELVDFCSLSGSPVAPLKVLWYEVG